MDLSKGIVLQLKYVAGRRVKYGLETQLEQAVQQNGQVLNETENSYEANLEVKTLAVEDDGSGHVLTFTTVPGNTDPNQRQVLYQRLGSRGEVFEVSGMNPTNSFSLPVEPVKMGSSWQGQVQIPLPQSATPMTCTTVYTVNGTEDYQGLQCLTIECHVEEFEFDLPLPDGSGVAKVLMGSHGSILFAPEEGILARMEIETVTSPHIGQVIFTTSTLITQEFKSLE